jgi:hypothetical protein
MYQFAFLKAVRAKSCHLESEFTNGRLGEGNFSGKKWNKKSLKLFVGNRR